MNKLNQHTAINAKASDALLIEWALLGHAMAYELIVRRYNQSLFRAAFAVLGNEAIAQELLQEAYIKAFTHLTDFKQQASLKTWLTRIVVNTAISYQRKQNIQSVSLDDSVIDLTIYQEHLQEKPQQQPDYEVERMQMKQVLESAIGQLPDIYRSVFILREIEQLPVADTVACLNISQDAVKTRLLRAKTLLKDLLSQKAEAYLEDTFEFAGARCDRVTSQVLTQLHQLNKIRQ